MARNGSGTYNLPEAAFVFDTVIDEGAVNNNFSDIATALSGSLAADGQTPVTANLPMATFRHTGVGNASARTDYAATGQVQDGAFIWCGTAGGTANALTLSPSPAITAYTAGQVFRFIAGASSSTSAVTIAVSGLSTKAVQMDGAALTSSIKIEAGKLYSALYDGTNFNIERLSERRGSPFNHQATNYSTRAVLSSVTGYQTILTSTFVKQSATSAVISNLHTNIYVPSTGPVFSRFTIGGSAVYSVAAKNTPSTAVSGTTYQSVVTGLAAGNQTWALALGREDGSSWGVTTNPTSTDNAYFPSSGLITSVEIHEVEL